jgi:uncharacterized protein
VQKSNKAKYKNPNPMKSIFFPLSIVLLTTVSFKSGDKIMVATGSGLPENFKMPVYYEVPPGAVKPEGWLLHQLQIMRDGTTGHLDEVYSKIKDSNGWLGGTGDGWEETPYWLDGAVPLAWLLADKPLQEKVMRYINWTLDHQRPSGYFGPVTKAEREKSNFVEIASCAEGEDWWPKMLMLKVMQQYYLASGDPRVIPFLSKYFAYQLATLNQCPLSQWTEWAVSRGTENILVAQWLYTINHDSSLLELASLIESQSFAWSTWLGNRDWVIEAAAHQGRENWMHRHGVNVGMGIKAPALNFQRTGIHKYLTDQKTGFNDLMLLHGLPMGIFSADEDLHGNNPEQGTELCALVEAMFSMEQTMAITGDVDYMDALERMAYNALPTQTTDNYNAKQYFQIANQVQVKKGVFSFSLPFDRQMTNVFGMRSGYTCCLANMHQGWSKFASHLWYATGDGGLAALEFAPCVVSAFVGQTKEKVTIKEITDYPFDEKIRFEVGILHPVEFSFSVRIPGWCNEAVIMLNGIELERKKGGQVINIVRTWKNGDILSVQLPMQVKISEWGRNSRAVERGPLVYALKLNERWEKGHDEEEGDYFCVYPTGKWNYGLSAKAITDPANQFEFRKTPQSARLSAGFIWNLSHVPGELITTGRRIPSWQLLNDVAPIPVTDRNGLFKGEVNDSVETITLVPYGFTKVRIVAFPIVP